MGMDEDKSQYSNLIAARMRESLGKKGIVLKYLYEKLGVSHTTMTNYLNGKSLPDLYVLKRFAEICDTSLAYIVCGEKEIKNNNENKKLYSEIDQYKGQISLLKEMLDEKAVYGKKKSVRRDHANDIDH